MRDAQPHRVDDHEREPGQRRQRARSAELRRAGQDPERIKATVRASLKAVEAVDVEAITRQAMESVDPTRIEAALAAAQEGMRKAESELDRLEALDRSN